MGKLKDIYIVDCKRTAIASANRGLKNFTAAQLAAFVIDGILDKNKFAETSISEVILGNTVSAGTGQNLARQAVFLSGLPKTTPAYVVNNVCGSGLQAVVLGAQKILAEGDDFVLAGAAESATHNPQLVFQPAGDPVESLLRDGLLCPLAGKYMGDICEELAKEKDISRQKQDEYSFESHRRACAARAAGKFDKEIVPVKDGNSLFDKDERPRKNTSLKKLGRLPAVFSEGGTITAGNASAPSDGACAFLLASSGAIEKNNLSPIARILGYVSIAVEPKRVFADGAVAINECLTQCGLSLDDIDLFEIVEAFAAQAVFTQQSLNIPKRKMNFNGGDIALGHPLGIAGARVLVTLIHALIDQKKKRGLAFVAFGAGGAIAMIVETVF